MTPQTRITRAIFLCHARLPTNTLTRIAKFSHADSGASIQFSHELSLQPDTWYTSSLSAKHDNLDAHCQCTTTWSFGTDKFASVNATKDFREAGQFEPFEVHSMTGNSSNLTVAWDMRCDEGASDFSFFIDEARIAPDMATA
jgi:hypothetical protein